MVNTKKKKTYVIFTLKRILKIFDISLEGIEYIHYRIFIYSGIVSIFKRSTIVVIFVRQFYNKKHYTLHRLLYFIRAVYLPHSDSTCRNVGVGYDLDCGFLPAISTSRGSVVKIGIDTLL